MPGLVALAFFLSGLSLAALSADRRRAGQALGFLVAALAFVGWWKPLWCTTVVLAACRAVGLTPPALVVDLGSMVALAAFVPAGLAMFLAKRRGRTEPALIGVVGAALFGLAVVAACAQLVGVHSTYLWAGIAPSGVPLSVTLGFVIVGAGVLGLAWIADRETFGDRPSLWAVSLTVGCFAMTLVSTHVVSRREEAYQRRAMAERARKLRDMLRTRVEDQLAPLFAAVDEWQREGRPERTRFEHEFFALINEHRSLRSVQWVDAAHELRWVAHREGEPAEEALHHFSETERSSLALVRELKRPTLTPTSDGELLLFLPIFPGVTFDGYLVGRFTSAALFGAAASEGFGADDAFSVVTASGRELFRRYDPNGGDVDGMALYGSHWDVAVRPGRAFLGLRAHLATVFFFAGLALTVLLGSLVAMMRSASVRLEERERIAFDLAASEAKLRRQATELTEARLSAVDALTAQGNFLRGLRTEMDAIVRRICESADELLASKLSAKQKESASTIRSWSEPLKLLLDDLTDFSPAEENKLRLRLVPFDLRVLLASLEELYAGPAKDRSATFGTRLEAVTPAVEGDPERLRRVLVHLADTALSCADGGVVVLRLTPLELTGDSFGARFAVELTSPRPLPEEALATEALADSVAAYIVRLMGGNLGIERRADGAAWWFTAHFQRSAGAKATPRKRRRA